MAWYDQDIHSVVEATGSSTTGLAEAVAAERLAAAGPNELAPRKKRPAWKLFLAQFSDFMILILIGAVIISAIAGDVTDAIIILLIVLLNAIIGFLQEYRAGRAIDSLSKIAALQAHVLRDGHETIVAASKLVRGDVVILEPGNLVPADLRLLETHGLRMDESILTGESISVDKHQESLQEKELPVADRRNMSFKGTIVTGGRGKGIVVETGMRTEIGRIAAMLDQDEPPTPLQLRMTDFSKRLSVIILLVCLMLLVIGIARQEDPLHMLLVAISLAVAAIPEALPALITISLAKGARRLVRRNALIRKLPAVETLGSVNFICTDKTGTLTQNRMTVIRTAFARETIIASLPGLYAIIALNNDVSDTTGHKRLGDPTELALVEHFSKEFPEISIGGLRRKLERIAELPFDAERKYMITAHRYGDKFLITVKGAPEVLVPIHGHTGAAKQWLNDAAEWAMQGERVIAFAYKIVDQLFLPLSSKCLEGNVELAGLVAIADPAREEVKDAISACVTAGITPVMITGDHPSTAAAIARHLGLIHDKDIVMTGKQLKSLSAEAFLSQVDNIRVYARVSPEQKLQIVRTLQQKGHFVSMTGDGVNDAPSLRAANIGVAMGVSGSDVSKEAAHMILLDDNFATIIRAIKEGRRIYDNIRKFVKYILTCNSAEIWTLFAAPLAGLPVPLQPIHVLWINLVTDGLPGLALANERAELNVMTRPPRKPNESLFAQGIGAHIIWVGLLMAGLSLGVQALAVYGGHANWQTMVFTVLSLSQLAHVMAIRSDTELFYSHGPFRNMSLLTSLVFTTIVQMIAIYAPFANRILQTQPLTALELLLCFGAAAILFHAVELEKWIRLRRKRDGN